MSAETFDEGRWYHLPDKTKVPSVTTILRRLHSFPLENWKMAKVAQYVAHDEELRALAYSDGYAAARQALQRGPNIGSALHGVSEMIDVGASVEGMPEIIAMQSRGYQEAMLAHQVKMVRTEIVVVNKTMGYAGRFDRIIQIHSQGEKRFLADVKTSKAVYAEVAMQLAAYANAEYILKDGVLEPMEQVDLDLAMVIHIGKDVTELVPIDISEAWLGFQGLLVCCAWQDGPAKKAVKEAIERPPVDPKALAEATEKRMAKIAAAVERMKEQEATDGAITEVSEETRIEEAEKAEPPYTYEPKRPDDSITVALDASHKQLATALTKFLNDEFKNMPEDARRMVLVLWPAEVMKFKAAREGNYTYTLVELETIEKIIADVSAQNGLPFPTEIRPGLAPKAPKPEPVPLKPVKAPTKTAAKPKKVAPAKTSSLGNLGNRCIICGKPTNKLDDEGNPRCPTCPF